MRNAACPTTTLFVAAAGVLMAQCRPAPPEYGEYGKERWGLIVLYEVKGACTELAGPPRIGAYPGDQVTWRIYNNCPQEAKVEIGDLRIHPSGFGGFAAAKSWEQIKELKRLRKGAASTERDPYEVGERGKQVQAGGIDDLSLKVKRDAQPGLYTYVVYLNGKADEGDQDIWPPK